MELAWRPSRARQLTKIVEDIGARFAEPSRFVVLNKATGVPKYKIAGSLFTCIGLTFGLYLF